MKTSKLSLVALVLGLPLGAGATGAPTLHVRLEPRFGDVPLVCDSAVYRTDAGQSISVSRLDLLASDFTLRRQKGGWLGPADWAAYVSAGGGRTAFDVPGIPRGRYDRLAFFIGLSPTVNRADPSGYGPEHPLNPNVNGLHWGWQGGYVFLAFEGGWFPKDKELHGYSYHLATDRQLMRVEVPVDLTVTNDVEVRLAFDVRRIFGAPNVMRLADDTATTHSREGDPLADQLRRNIEDAFSLLAVRPLDTVGGKPQPPNVTLAARDATPFRLMIPRYFSPPPLPAENPLTEEGVRLGALLFFDPRLSVNNSQSCASCHHPEAGFADPGHAVSRGAGGTVGTRNSMPLFNLAWKSSFFWDGRAASLREQVLQPIQNPIEMHETLENIVNKLKSSRVNSRHEARALETIIRNREATTNQNLSTPAPAHIRDYSTLFARAFGTPEVTADRVARALEQYVLTRVSHDSKFDRFVKGQAQLTAEEKRGLELFNTEYDPRRRQFGADCFHCHNGPLFQSQTFANNGLDADFTDLGRYLTTKREGDKGKFAVPSLRNVAVTAPYMHDGRFKTLEEVIEHYSGGVKRSPTLDPNLAKHPGGGVPLDAADKQAIVAFLRTLTDERYME